MEQLADIQLLDINGFTLDLFQLVTVGIMGALLFLLYWVLERRIYPWYYGLEYTTEKNRARMRRVTRFAMISFFIVGVLRLLDVDNDLFNYLKLREKLFPEEANDGAGGNVVIKISTLLEVLVAFVIVNVLDLVLGEIVTQRFHRLRTRARRQGEVPTRFSGDIDRIKWLKPALYTLVAILFANLTGLAAKSPFDLTSLGKAAAAVKITIGNLLNALLVFFLVSLLLNFVITFLLKGYYHRSKVDIGSQFAINRLLTYFVYFIGVLLVLQTAGFNLIGIWTGAAALLVGIGIGLQQTFNDLICGVIILFERSVKVGDVVERSGHKVGTVRRIGARTSVVETRDDIIIFVPNSKLIGENVTNWSQVERQARFHVTVGVAYGSDTELVKEVLLAAANDHNSVLDSPPPIVRFLDFGDSSLNFEVLFWSRDFMRIENVKSDIRFAIDAAFRAKKVEIPFPQRDLWIRGGLQSTLPVQEKNGNREEGEDAGAGEVKKA